MAITTTQFVDELVESLVAHGLDVDDAATLKAEIVDQVGDWLGSTDALPASLAQMVTQAVADFQAEILHRYDFWFGVADGGPGGDGFYDFTLTDGTTVTNPCLARVLLSLNTTAKGDPGGVSFVWSTATADADPGAGKVSANNASAASVTKVFFDDVTANSLNVAGWLANLGDPSASGSKGALYLQNATTGAVAIFTVTGPVVAASGYHKVPVAFVAGALPAALDRISAIFAPQGGSQLYGAGAPGSGLGAIGDIYLNVSTGDFYGPKTASGWGGATASGLTGFVNAAAASASAAATSEANAAASAAAALAAVSVKDAFTGTPAYTNPGGTGARKSLITVTATAGLLVAGAAPNLVDGNTTSSSSGNSVEFVSGVAVAGHYFLFDFGVDAAKVVNEAKLYQSGATSHGVWKWQGSSDGAAFTDIGATFTLGVTATQVQVTLAANVTPYRYYRLLGVSGNASASPFIGEIEFKIGAGQADGKATRAELVAYEQAQLFPAGFPTSKLISAYFFDPAGVNGSTVVDQWGSNPIDLTLPTNPNVTQTGRGVRLLGGLVQAPAIAGVVGETYLYRCDKDGATGFLSSGEGGGTGGGVTQVSVPTTGKTHFLGGGVSFHTPIFNTSNSPGTAATELNRGNWGAIHREFTSFAGTVFGKGGRVTLTANRCAEMELHLWFLWNAALTTSEEAAVEAFLRARALRFGIFLHSNDCPIKEDVYIIIGESTASGRAALTELPVAKQSYRFSAAFIAPWNGGATVYPWQPLQMGLNQQIPNNSTIYAAGSFTQYRTNNFANGDTIKVGAQTYTWKAALTGAANEVLIGASFAASAANFIAALTAGSGAGTTYGTGTAANASAIGYVPAAATSIVLLAKTAGATSVAVTYTPTGATIAGSWADSFLGGGRGGGALATYADAVGIEYSLAVQREAALLAGTKRRPARFIKIAKGSTFWAPASTGYAGGASSSWNASENIGAGLVSQGITQLQQSLGDMIALGIGFASVKYIKFAGLNDGQSVTYVPDVATYQGYHQAEFNMIAGVLPGITMAGYVFLPHTRDPSSNATAIANAVTALTNFAAANGLTAVSTQTAILEPDGVHYTAEDNRGYAVTAH